MSVDQEVLSQDEFVRLLAAHSSKLMSYIRIITMNRQDDAEEVFQRTCMVMWQKFQQFDRGNFAAWGCRIAHFETLKLRDSKNQIKVLGDEAMEYLALAALPIASGISERRNALSGCLKKLPDSDHDLIRQRYFEGQSVGEISKRIGRSTHAVYRELSRVHGLLSRCIKRSVTEGAT